MPILALETSIYPPPLLDSPAANEMDRRWLVVATKPRQEKSLARQLVAKEIPFYLPLISKTRCVQGRRVSSHLPLFDGYLFLLSTDDERLAAVKTNRIVRFLDVTQPQRLVDELQYVRRLIESKVPLTVESRLVTGDAVRVKSGPFAGMEGTVIRRQGKERLLLAVNCLQQGVSVELSDFMVERI